VAPAAGELADGLLTIARVRSTHLFSVGGVRRWDQKKRCDEEMRKSNGHCWERVLGQTLNLVCLHRRVDYKSANVK
ncbi:MAG: hypothetical protein ACREMY_01480, partial [bacterium]